MHRPFAADLAQGAGAHQGIVAARQLTLALLRKVAQQQVGHGERQHPVAQKLQPFVAVGEGRLQRRLAVEGAAMGQRLGGKFRPRERMSDALRQRRQSGVVWPQWIAWKKRLKRIACGHFHGSSHPAADGSWEKKMNSARPTRFSAGTYQPSSSRVRLAPRAWSPGYLKTATSPRSGAWPKIRPEKNPSEKGNECLL